MSLQGSRKSPFKRYEFEPQHIPGRNNVIFYALFKVTLLELQDSNAEKDILAVNFLQYSSLEERERDQVLLEKNKDQELQAWQRQFLQDGQWREARFQCSCIFIGILEMSSL